MSEIDFLSEEEKNQELKKNQATVEYTSPQVEKTTKAKDLEEPGFFKSLFTGSKKDSSAKAPVEKKKVKDNRQTEQKKRIKDYNQDYSRGEKIKQKNQREKDKRFIQSIKEDAEKVEKPPVEKSVVQQEVVKPENKYSDPEQELLEDVVDIDMLDHLKDKPIVLKEKKVEPEVKIEAEPEEKPKKEKRQKKVKVKKIKPEKIKKIKPEKIKKIKPEKVKKIKKVKKKKIKEQSKKDKESKHVEVDVNLIPEEFLDELSPRNKIKSLLTAFIVSMVIMGAIYGVLYSLQYNAANRIEEINKEISNVEKEIDTYSVLKKEVNEFNKISKNVKEILSTHVYWSQFFDMLAKNTIDDVYYTSVTGNVTGSIVISAVAKDYTSVSRQINAFEMAEGFVENVEVLSATTSQIILAPESEDTEPVEKEVVVFDIKLTVLPDIFYYNYEE